MNKSASPIYHEHLEEVNTPFYFHEFASRAEAAGLQYLADTELSTMLPTHMSAEAQQVLANVPLIRKEQYMDFIRNRTFRKTLVCHAEARLNRMISVWELEKFHLALSKPAEMGEPDETGVVQVQIGNSTLSSRDPLVLGSLRYLNDNHPNLVPFAQMFEVAVASLPAGSPTVTHEGPFSKQSLLTAFTTALFSGMIDLAIHPPKFVRQVSERPEVTPLARWQAERGNRITNRRHEMVKLDVLTRYFVRRFDGRHHVVQLRQELSEQIRTGQMKLQDGDRVISFEKDTAEGIIQQVLTKLSINALLVN